MTFQSKYREILRAMAPHATEWGGSVTVAGQHHMARISILGRNRVEWRVCVNRQWRAGEASDRYHALEDLLRAAA